MTKRRVLLVHENVPSARYIQHLLEDAGYAVEWRPAVSPTLLRSGAIPDAVVFDLHFLDQEDQATLRLLREHARWHTVPVLVTAAVLHRKARMLLSRLGADDLMLRPTCREGGQELHIRLLALLGTAEQTLPGMSTGTESVSAMEWTGERTSLAGIAELVTLDASAHTAEAVLVQLLRSFRKTVPFDVGFVCAETEPDRYAVVAHLGDDAVETAPWYEPGVSFTGWMALHKKPLLVPDVENDSRVKMLGRELGSNRNIQSFVGVPLMSNGHVVGTIEAACCVSGALGAHSLTALQHTAEVASLALRHVQARRRLAVHVQQRCHGSVRDQAVAPVCQSPSMLRVLETVSRVCNSHVPVLITGETGTGKEMLARYLHATSRRYQQPFVAVSCAAVPETFQSREFFGIEAGVLPGVEERIGRLEEAAGGTLLLDDVGQMSMSLQAKLLRALDQRSFSRIGSSASLAFTGRVIATTTADLKSAIHNGTFLPELYHRLAVIELALPPLRLRAQDIVPLFQHFARQFSAEHGSAAPELKPSEVVRLLAYSWPGNVRELRNAVERSILLGDGEGVSFADENPSFQGTVQNLLLLNALEQQWSVPELQARYARFVYEQVGHNKAEACRRLRINYRTLRNHIDAPSDAIRRAC